MSSPVMPSGEAGGQASIPAPSAPSTPSQIRPIPSSPSPAGGAAAPTTPSAPAAPAAPSPGGQPAGADAGKPEEVNASKRNDKGQFTSKPELPGVHTDRFKKPKEPVAAVPQPGKPGEAKGGDGKTVPLPPGVPEATGDQPAKTAGGFKFAGKDWESPEQAEQNFRTLQGMHRSLNQRISELDKFNQQNNYSASQWKQKAEQLQARLEALEKGQPVGQGAASAAGGDGKPSAKPAGLPESADDLLKDVDLGLVEEIANERGPLVAAHYLYKEGTQRMLAAVREELSRVKQPFETFQANMQMGQVVTGLIEDLAGASYEGADGKATPVYPELSDPQAMQAITAIWERLGFSDEARLSPMALTSAILHYRNMLAMRGGGGGPSPAGLPAQTATTSTPASGAGLAAAAVTASLTGSPVGGDSLSGQGGSAVRPTQGAESMEDRIRREVRESPGQDPVLGFVRRQRK